MRINSWGALVVGGLTVTTSCAAPPPPEAPPPPPPPPPPATVEAPLPKPGELVDPPNTAKGLGGLRTLFASTASVPRSIAPTSMVAFGKGALAYVDLSERRQVDLGCPVAGVQREECQFLRVSTWSGAAPSAVQWRAANPGQGTGAWSKLIAAKRRWGNLSPGQDVVYAVRREGALTIDTIDAKGEIAPLLQADAAHVLTDVDVVELAGGALLAIGRDEGNSLEVVEVQRGAGGQAKLGESHDLKITAFDTDSGAGADSARAVIAGGNRVAMGRWSAAPLIDKSGAVTSSAVVAWTEALPPPKYTPAGKAYLGPKPRPKSGPAGARHGCGRSSRPLHDLSVEKRIHLTRLSAKGAVVEDKVVAVPTLPEIHEGGQPLALQVYAGGVEVNGQRFDEAFAPQANEASTAAVPVAGPLAKPPFEGSMSAAIVAAGYDVPSGEGIVVVQDGKRMSAQLFDGLGEPKGEPFSLLGSFAFTPRSMPSVARAGTTWVGLQANGQALQVLNGPNQGETIAIDVDSSTGRTIQTLALLPGDDDRVRVVKSTWGSPLELLVINVDVRDRTVTTVTHSSVRVHMATDEGALLVMPGPTSDDLTFVGRRPNGSPLIGRLDAMGKWSDIPARLDDTVGAPKRTRTHEIWRDAALLVEGEKGSVAFWASDAKSAPLPSLGAFVAPSKPVSKGAPAKQSVRGAPANNRRWGPFAGNGKWHVPDRPGDLVATDDALSQALVNCPYAFPTGPGRTLLVCSEATDPSNLSGRVGLRVFRR